MTKRRSALLLTGLALLLSASEGLAQQWQPILDVCQECGLKYALEVHPGQIAFDLYSAEMVLDALNDREEFGFTFDPSHLHWQGVDAVEFAELLFECDATRRRFPPVQIFVERFAGDGADARIEQAGAAEMQHRLGHGAAGVVRHRRGIVESLRRHQYGGG